MPAQMGGMRGCPGRAVASTRGCRLLHPPCPLHRTAEGNGPKPRLPLPHLVEPHPAAAVKVRRFEARRGINQVEYFRRPGIFPGRSSWRRSHARHPRRPTGQTIDPSGGAPRSSGGGIWLKASRELLKSACSRHALAGSQASSQVPPSLFAAVAASMIRFQRSRSHRHPPELLTNGFN